MKVEKTIKLDIPLIEDIIFISSSVFFIPCTSFMFRMTNERFIQCCKIYVHLHVQLDRSLESIKDSVKFIH